jgi:dynein heavy chain, axonemal
MVRLKERAVKTGVDELIQGQESESIKAAIKRIFAFALVWGVGGNLVCSQHEAFDECARGVIGNFCPLPNSGSVFDLFVDVKNFPVELYSWNDHIPSFVYNPSAPFFSMLVPTLDTCRCDPHAHCLRLTHT